MASVFPGNRTQGTCVVGMHRSGTSLVARLLDLCGLDLGTPDRLLPANDSNPLGYFENRELADLDEALLAHRDGFWDDPPELSEGWEHDPSLEPFVVQARSLLATFKHGSPWGWKDPRASLVLPFWYSLVPDLRCVICVRSPLDVARSLARRDRIPIAQGARLWYRYTRTAIRDTQGHARLFCLYDRFFDDANGEIDRLTRFCGLGSRPEAARLKAAEAEAAIAAPLRHHRSTIDELLQESKIASKHKLLYLGLRTLGADRQASISDTVEPYLNVLDRYADDEELERLHGALADTELKLVRYRTGAERTNGNRSASARHQLVFPPVTEPPLVSIVIPTYNCAEQLLTCLRSILVYTDESTPYEVILVDDASDASTARFLKSIRNITLVRNEENLDFLRSCNRGAKRANGRYLLFLNNDVTVTHDWLKLLVETVERDPKCGAVGGKLIFMDGTLQEAGSIIWSDGSALGYGRGANPFAPEYSYLREVDYCSGACLMVRTGLFESLGGFDERFAPAYYEEVDLCFRLRQLGYRTLFQPHAIVFHHEYGSRPSERAVALMAANQVKFAAKWPEALRDRYLSSGVLMARDRSHGKRVLVLDDRVPAPYLGSGFPRAFKILSLLAELGLKVTFLPLTNRHPYQPATRQLQQLGIEILYGGDYTLEYFLQARRGHYDAVIVSRPHNAEKCLECTRQYLPAARIVYDAEALFCIREIRQAKIEGRALSENEKARMLQSELDLMKGTDVVITVSEQERQTILGQGAHPHVTVLDQPQVIVEPVTPFADRKDILFVGGFIGSHPPNVDGVRHFAHVIFPRIREVLPECRFFVVGSNPPESITSLELLVPGIVVTGFVEDLDPWYERCRVFIGPQRFGAGTAYKVIQALAHGIPSVLTESAANGLDLEDERDALIATDDQNFADKVIRLYQDEVIWSVVRTSSLDFIRKHFSHEVMKRTLAEILDLPPVPPAPHSTSGALASSEQP